MIDPIELNALADGQLTSEEANRVRSAMEADSKARVEYAAIVLVKRIVREKTSAPEHHDAWRACVGRLDELDRSKRAETLVTKYAWAFCGVFLVAILVGGMNKRATHSDTVNIADLSRIVTSLTPRKSPPPAAEAARNRWLDQLLGQARRSVDPNRMEIIGYTNGTLDDRPVTHFALRDSSGPLALLVIPGTVGNKDPQGEKVFHLGHLQGMNCVVWTDRNVTLAVVADRTHQELVRAAVLLQGGPN